VLYVLWPTEAVYIGKSLGTLHITDFYMQHSSVPSRYVLLKPLLSLEHVMKNLLGKQAFLAIDTADHSLEIATNIVESIIICQSLLAELKAYLQ